MQETHNNCFGSKKCSTTLRQAKTGKRECRNITATYLFSTTISYIQHSKTLCSYIQHTPLFIWIILTHWVKILCNFPPFTLMIICIKFHWYCFYILNIVLWLIETLLRISPIHYKRKKNTNFWSDQNSFVWIFAAVVGLCIFKAYFPFESGICSYTDYINQIYY